MKPYELTNMRLRLGLSQAELARRLGVHLLTVNRWEMGHHRIHPAARQVLIRMDEDWRAAREAEARGSPGTGGTSSATVAKRNRRA